VLLAPDGRTITNAALDAASAAAARRLAGEGLGAGSVVVVSCAPSLDLVVAYVALLRLGATVLPANTGYTEFELEYIVGDAEPVAAVVDEDRRETLIRLGIPTVLGPAVDVPDPGMTVALDQAAPTAPALIAYTSGTTGAPKGAVLSHRNLLAGAEALRRAWAWSRTDRLVLALPLFHMHGLGVGLNGTLLVGASAVVLPAFSVDAVLDAVRDHGATMFFGVPTMYARLAASKRLPELAALRLCVSGSAPLAPELWERIRRGCGQEVLERYGMTETVMLASNPLHGVRRPGSVGRALPGVELRLGAGDVVEVRGPSVFTGYLGRPEASAAAFTPDGWFRTGDIGVIDDDGVLSLVGRSSELIITGGYNVYPREIEDVLRSHPLVDDVAVVGLPDETWGETVTAFVVLDGSASAYSSWRDSLTAHCVERLAPYKLPRAWHRVAALPRNAMGKVVRGELTESFGSVL
jgi:malonyl-CoA/methylmalonyl-CoA synthetase